MLYRNSCIENRLFKLFLLIAVVSTVIVLTIYYITNNVMYNSSFPRDQSIRWISLQQQKQQQQKQQLKQHQFRPLSNQQAVVVPEKYNEGELRNRLIREKIKILTGNSGGAVPAANTNNGDKSYQQNNRSARMYTKNVQIFYSFPVQWYGGQQSNGVDATQAAETALRNATDVLAPTSMAAGMPQIVFYPLLGLYQPEIQIIEKHLRDIQSLGTNVLIVTWSPRMPQYQLRFLMDAAGKHGMQVALEIDAYVERTPASLLNDLSYLHREFWFHQSFYKVYVQSKKRMMPIVYIRDADTIIDTEWWKLLSFNGPISVRRSLYDAVFIGHISTKTQISSMRRANFNGIYNRISSNGANYISTWKNWAAIKKSTDKLHLLFIPTVAPGYNEDKKQPKVVGRRRHRTNGQYYGVAWRTAISISAQFVSIASYNDWLSGTQIEEAIPKTGYRDYLPGQPSKYLDLTRHWLEKYIRATTQTTADTQHCHQLFNNTLC